MKKILLCEDEDVMITAIEFRLQKIGCPAVKTRNHDGALQALELEHPSLAIVSLTLPDNGGMRLLDHIRGMKGPRIPVIIISTLEQEEEVMEAYAKGADDFITKPFKPTELVLRVMHLLDQQGQ
jgi:two-component system response regulator VicR